MSLPGWEGGGWVTLHINPTFTYGQLDQLAIKSPNTNFLKRSQVCLGPILTNLQASGGFLIRTKIKAYTKPTLVMCCQIDDQKYTAPFCGRFLQRPPPLLACGQSPRHLEKQSPSLSHDLFMYFLSQNKKNLDYFFLSCLVLNILKPLKQPFSIRKMRLKCLSLVYSCFQAFRCLVTKIKLSLGKVTKTKNEAQGKLIIKRYHQKQGRRNC